MKFRTSNRQSLKFRMRMALRRTRTRVLTELISMLEGSSPRATA